jgi:diadenosine tetraphosphate (Ap4A) HIT family hydrolase
MASRYCKPIVQRRGKPPHLHLHVLPRYENDGVIPGWRAHIPICRSCAPMLNAFASTEATAALGPESSAVWLLLQTPKMPFERGRDTMQFMAMR